MRWVSHCLVAGSTIALFEPKLIPIACLGSTAPDWLEHVANRIFKQHFEHRKQTHYVLIWLCLLMFSLAVWDYSNLLAAFFYGALSHVFLDSLTISGVPFSPFSKTRFHLLGGRIRTGSIHEYIFAISVTLVCITIFQLFINTKQTGFYPFIWDWQEYYEQGLIDANEWKRNRFKIF